MSPWNWHNNVLNKLNTRIALSKNSLIFFNVYDRSICSALSYIHNAFVRLMAVSIWKQ